MEEEIKVCFPWNEAKQCSVCQSAMKIVNKTVHRIVEPPQVHVKFGCTRCFYSVRIRYEDDWKEGKWNTLEGENI